MNESQPSAEPLPAPTAFSLRTLFLFVTCTGVASVAFRVADNGIEGVAIAGFLVGIFLTFWFLATRQFTRMRAAVLLTAVGIFLSVLLPVRSRGGDSRRGMCMNNLRQIGLALLAYHQQYGSFPPAFVADANGKPLYSWRVLILPQLDNNILAQQIRNDETWDGPNNATPTRTELAVFDCPSDTRSRSPAGGSPAALTNYVAVVGPHTAWAGATPRKLSDFKNPSRTILVVEIANSGIHWAEPRDLNIGQMPPRINPQAGQGISSDHPGGVNALFADGSVHFLGNEIDPKKLAELLDLDGCNDQAAIDGEGQLSR